MESRKPWFHGDDCRMAANSNAAVSPGKASLKNPPDPQTQNPQLGPACDDLVREHLPLVGYLVAEAASRLPGHVSRDDLNSAGMMALVQAARAFDASRGVPFARYASVRIRGGIIDELRGHDWAS